MTSVAITELDIITMVVPRSACSFIQITPREILKGANIFRVGLALSCFHPEVGEVATLHGIKWRFTHTGDPYVSANGRPDRVVMVGNLQEAERFRLTVAPFKGTVYWGSKRVSGLFLRRWEAVA